MAKGFTTIARSFRGGLGPKPAKAYIVPLDGFNGDDPIDGETRTFQYFPATISDSHATNYQTKVIPGLSHPLYQWTSGGERIISFEAVFSRDRTYSSAERSAIIEGGGRGAISSLGRAAVTPISAKFLGIASNDDPRNVDIPSAVAWLRSFLLPEYATDSSGTRSPVPSRPHPPRKMILGMPGVRMNWGVPTLPHTEVYVIMKGCEVSYQAFFHDGTPRLAKVSLSFAEIIQVGGRIVVQDGHDKRLAGFGGYTLTRDG